ncbi:MAG: methyltransferase domain-containing protein [Candidatus Hydrogenedentes bacterium]|nr:methyltransferase domain-containing protein [Candidatus Hydrogenedentota bacterium]
MPDEDRSVRRKGGGAPLATSSQQLATDYWRGEFGREYTDRNPQSVEAMDALYLNQFGLTRTDLNREFLGDLDPASRILELGANVGVQLQALRTMGFGCVYGVELQDYAIRRAHEQFGPLALAEATGLDLPFADAVFDVVFTSGVLIHIHPDRIGEVLAEIHRTTRRYIWGWEYYADNYAPVSYRGRRDLLWKGNFTRMYLERFSDLELVKQKRVKYLANENVDVMFLLGKKA